MLTREHPIAHSHGRAMGCILWAQNLIYISYWPVWCHRQCYVILNCVITWHGSTFRITGSLWREFICYCWFSKQRSFNVSLLMAWTSLCSSFDGLRYNDDYVTSLRISCAPLWTNDEKQYEYKYNCLLYKSTNINTTFNKMSHRPHNTKHRTYHSLEYNQQLKGI